MRVEDGGENGKTFNSAATDITAIIPKASATGVPPPPSFSPNMREEISLYNVIYCSHHREVNSVSKVPTFLRCFTSHDFNDTFFFALYLVLLFSTPRRPSLLTQLLHAFQLH